MQENRRSAHILHHFLGCGSVVGGLIGTLDLDEGEANVVECIAHGGRFFAQAVAETVDQAGNGVNGENGLFEVIRMTFT